MILNEAFWDDKYQSQETAWDIGNVSTPLKTYIDQLTNKDLKILIPGGGNSYEAEYLFYKGFINSYVIDISKTALNNIKLRVPDFPENQLIHKNFFDLDATFDLIIEQTFFCAISPNLRPNYVNKMYNLLNKNGKLVGLLFNIPLNITQPPFGGCKENYLTQFKPLFKINILEACYNSIEKRTGNELFFKFTKK